jgi:hypothetical protein
MDEALNPTRAPSPRHKSAHSDARGTPVHAGGTPHPVERALHPVERALPRLRGAPAPRPRASPRQKGARCAGGGGPPPGQRWLKRAQKVGVFRSKPSEAGGESRGAYFPYASTLDAGIAKGSAERRRPSMGFSGRGRATGTSWPRSGRASSGRRVAPGLCEWGARASAGPRPGPCERRSRPRVRRRADPDGR